MEQHLKKQNEAKQKQEATEEAKQVKQVLKIFLTTPRI